MNKKLLKPKNPNSQKLKDYSDAVEKGKIIALAKREIKEWTKLLKQINQE